MGVQSVWREEDCSRRHSHDPRSTRNVVSRAKQSVGRSCTKPDWSTRGLWMNARTPAGILVGPSVHFSFLAEQKKYRESSQSVVLTQSWNGSGRKLSNFEITLRLHMDKFLKLPAVRVNFRHAGRSSFLEDRRYNCLWRTVIQVLRVCFGMTGVNDLKYRMGASSHCNWLVL